MRGFDERTINLFESLHVPPKYWAKTTLVYQYWFRSLLQKIDSSLIFKGLPNGWSNDYLMLSLWSRGFVCVFDSTRKDLLKYGNPLFANCSLSGYDFYHNPTIAQVNTPIYTKDFKIGKDAEILKLTPDFCGVFDIIDFYAERLAELTKGLDVSIKNTKYVNVIGVKNEAQAETVKRIHTLAQDGEELVVYKQFEDDGEMIPTKELFESWSQDFNSTYIIDRLLRDMSTLLDKFYVEIGLPVAIEKKERIVTSEADFASAQSQARIACWAETLRESLEVINKHFNTNIEVILANEFENNTDRDTTGIDEA